MSLILDALRKADSERERESVPGLHTQPVPPLSLEMPAAPRGTPWRWIALGSIALLVIALAWVLLGREAARPPAERAAMPEPAAPAPGPMVNAANAVVPNAVAPNAITPNAIAPHAIALEPPKEVAPPAPWPAPERKAAPKAQGRADAPAKPDAQVAAVVPAVYAREQLPDNIRAALPPLAVGGSIFSNTPANRSVILDGRLYRENEQIAADLLLEEIGMKTAVLRFRGYRFEIRY